MADSFFAEISKLWRRPAVWILVALWCAMALAFGYLIPYLVYQNPPSGGTGFDSQGLLASIIPSGWLGNVVGGMPLFGAAMIFIVGALVRGSEFGWNTVSTVMTQGPSRLKVLAGKLGALALVVIGFEVVVFAPGAATSALVARSLDAPLEWPAVAEVLRVFAGGFLILAVWTALGLALAVVFCSTPLPIGLGLVWLLVIESLVEGFASQLSVLETIRQGLPGAAGGSLAASFLPQALADTPGVSAVTGPVHAVVVLSLWAIAVLLGASLLLSRRDLS